MDADEVTLLMAPHAIPLRASSISVAAVEVLETITWLVQRVVDQHNSLAQFSRAIRSVQGAEQRRIVEAQQQEEALESRFLTLETLCRQGGVAANLGGLGGAVEAPLERSIRALELDILETKAAQKLMESALRHQEKHRELRDEAQEEMRRLSLQRLGSEIETCLKQKDLEPIRSMAKLASNTLEIELRAEVQQMHSTLQEYLQQQIASVNESLSKIANSSETQIRLIDDRVTNVIAAGAQRVQLESAAEAAATPIVPGVKGGQLSVSGAPMVEAPLPAKGGVVTVRSKVDSTPKSSHAGGEALELANAVKEWLPAISGEQVLELERRLAKVELELGLVVRSSLESCTRVAEEESHLDHSTSPKAGVLPPGTPAGGARPSRIEKLEVAHISLTNALAENLGLVVGDKREEEDVATTYAETSRPPTRPTGSDSARKFAMSVPHKLDLLTLELKEVALAVGLDPVELEAYALSGAPAGQFALRTSVSAGGPRRQRSIEAGEVSPRVAGVIASQTDALRDIERSLKGLEGAVDELSARIAAVESMRATSTQQVDAPRTPQTPARGRGTPIARATTQTTIASPETGGTGNVESAALSILAEQLARLGGVPSEIARLKDDDAELALQIRKLASDIAALSKRIDAEASSRGNATAEVGTNLGGAAKAAAMEAVAVSAKRAEAAAVAAEAAAVASTHLRDELREILLGVNVPMATSTFSQPLERENIRFQMQDADIAFHDPCPGESPEEQAAREKEAAQDVSEYVERQMQVEARLQEMELRLEEYSENPELIDGLRAVVMDVRKCLQRCELLFQLPEIRMFVRKFQRSLEINAMLQKKWFGPGGKEPEVAGEGVGRAPSKERPDGQSEDTRRSQSASDLTTATKARRDMKAGKKQGDSKKKPFRTVVDWVRPHTPLKLDPQSRGQYFPSGPADEPVGRPMSQGGAGLWHLPHIAMPPPSK